MAITVSIESPLQDDVRALVAELNTYLMPLTPGEFQFQLTAEQMAEPSVTLFVARDAGARALGMGALKEHGGGLGEVKRMYTLPTVRGQRIGRRILERIESLARQKGIIRLVLETGEAASRLRARLSRLRARRLRGLRGRARLPRLRLFPVLRKEA